jgi:hypothetical protein
MNPVAMSSTLPSIGFAISASQSGRMSLPVAPAMYIYSHFEHVSGVPAPEGTRGVTISKLKILDTLIEQLSRLKSQGNVELEAEGKTEEQVDFLIEQYEQQIRQAQATSVAMPYATDSLAVTGAVFNLVA